MIVQDLKRLQEIMRLSMLEAWEPKIEEAVNYIEDLERKLNEEYRKESHTGWIMLEDMVPNPGEMILVCTEGGYVCESFCTQKDQIEWYRYGITMPTILTEKVIKWMPMPKGDAGWIRTK